jgi:hypothetical protein
MKEIINGDYVPYLFHMSWTTNKENKLVFSLQMGLWYTNKECESDQGGRGGGGRIRCCMLLGEAVDHVSLQGQTERRGMQTRLGSVY